MRLALRVRSTAVLLLSGALPLALVAATMQALDKRPEARPSATAMRLSLAEAVRPAREAALAARARAGSDDAVAAPHPLEGTPSASRHEPSLASRLARSFRRGT